MKPLSVFALLAVAGCSSDDSPAVGASTPGPAGDSGHVSAANPPPTVEYPADSARSAQPQGTQQQGNPPDMGGAGSTVPPDMGGTGSTVVTTHEWSPQFSGVTTDLKTIWGSGENDIYVGGNQGTILHTDGSGNWTAELTGTTANFTSIWGSSANDVHAVGESGIPGVPGIHLHSDGSGTWKAESNPSGATTSLAVWGKAGSGEVFFAGSQFISHSFDYGATWTTTDFGAPTMLTGIAGDEAGTLVAVGNGCGSYAEACGLLLKSRDGGASWVSSAGGAGQPSAVFGNAKAGIWIAYLRPGFYAVDESGQWKSVGDMAGIWSDGASGGWNTFQVSLAGNLVYSANGSKFYEEPHGPATALYAVWGSSVKNMYAVGAGGLILHRNP